MAARKEETALGTARARFVEGLPRKASELRGAVALLAGTPDAVRPREEMRRRLHALYASAQVFRIGPLAAGLRDAIQRLDSARESGGELAQDDIDSLATLAATLPALAGDSRAGSPSTSPPALAPEPYRVPSRHPPPPSSKPPPPEDAHLEPLEPLPPMAPIPRPAPAPQEHTGQRPSRIPPAPRPHSEAPAMPLEAVISVLVADSVEWQAKIRAALPAERFEFVAASDPEAALRMARTAAPDVVIADRSLITKGGTDFISRLRSDPLTDFVPVILLLAPGTADDLIAVREEGADETLGKPFEAPALLRAIARLTGNVPSDGDVPGHFGDLTPSEVADRLATEIRRGIAESAEVGKDVRVPVGDGAELLAAAWAAIGRVRAHLASRSSGRVRFRDSARRGGPAVLALVDDDAEDHDAETEVSLRGRRVIVVDDDPAVVWFFAGLLREEGAEVFEAANGVEALENARARRPDLIISDILMPELDGFGLCRELQRDPALRDVPVILLSWKEDFLQRMRELSAGASGYLRKEAGSAQILSKVRAVLRPRARLEAQLAAGGEVRGRVEGVGMLTLLRSVAGARPLARVTVRDAWNLYEVDIQDGDLVDVTRTATDGSFVRGPRALPALLGIISGRFTMTDGGAAIRGTIRTPLEDTLADGTSRLRAVLDAVSGTGIAHASRIGFDPDVLGSFVRTSPARIHRIVDRIANGEEPRELLADGAVEPQVLESVLVDLARRGGITEVVGPDGEDRIATVLRGLRSRTPGSAPAAASSPERRPRGRKDSGVAELDPPFGAGGPGPVSEPPPGPLPEPPLEPLAAPVPEPLDAPLEDEEAEPLVLSKRSTPPGPPAPEEPPAEPPGVVSADATDGAGLPDLTDEIEGDRKDATPARSAAEYGIDPTGLEPLPTLEEEPEPEASAAEDVSEATPEAATPAAESALAAPDTTGPAPAAADQAQSESTGGLIGWLFLLVVFGVLGFAGYSLIAGSPPETPAGEGEPAVAPVVPEGLVPPVAPQPDGGEAPDEDELSFGRVLDFIDAGGVEVAPNEGMLVIEANPQGPPSTVRIADRDLGLAPARLLLPEGRHELVFRRGDETSYRYLHIRRGQTLVMQAP